jgi:hypothetical protein
MLTTVRNTKHGWLGYGHIFHFKCLPRSSIIRSRLYTSGAESSSGSAQALLAIDAADRCRHPSPQNQGVSPVEQCAPSMMGMAHPLCVSRPGIPRGSVEVFLNNQAKVVGGEHSVDGV